MRPRLGKQRVGLSGFIAYFEIALSEIPFPFLPEEVVKRTFSFFFRAHPLPYRMAHMGVTVAYFLGGPVLLCRDTTQPEGKGGVWGTVAFMALRTVLA